MQFVSPQYCTLSAGGFCFCWVFFAVILNCEFPIRDLLILKLEEEQLIPSARGVYAFLLLSPPLLDLHETSMTATSVHAALSLQPFKYMI